MPQVPVYQRTERQRPVNQQGVTVQASPGDFGAQVGQGMQALAQGADRLGDAVKKVNDMRAETEAREARNAWMREKDAIFNDPQTGYLNQSGKNALDAWTSTQERIRAARQKYAEGLSPAAARMYDQSIDVLENDAFSTGMKHTGGEFKQYVVQEGIAGATNFQNEALRHSSDPAMADKYTNAALMELRDVYSKQGLPPEAIEVKSNEFLSDTTKKMALSLAAQGTDGVLQAKAYIDKNQARLTPGDKLTLDDALKSPLIAAKATRNMQALVSGAPTQRYDGPEQENPTPRPGIPRVDGNIGQVLGSLQGMTEGRDGAAISSFIKNSTGISINPQVTPWCAAFVNAVLATQGVEGTGKLNARSFMNFGMATDNPKPGDIVVFKRGDDPSKGHVGFFNGFDDKGNIVVTGGNQSNSVRTSTYSKDDLLGFRTAGNVSEATAKMPSYSPQGIAHIYERLQTIADPEEREATRKAVDAYYTTQKKMMDAQEEQVQNAASQMLISNPTMNLNTLPIEMQYTLGAKGMTTLLNYQEKIRSQGQPTTDYRVLYNLQTEYANDPTSFAQRDLFQYRDKLSNSDWQTVTGWRQGVISGNRKDIEEGKTFADGMNQAQQALAAAGLTTVGVSASSDPAGRQEIERRIGLFQSEFIERVKIFQTANKRSPNYEERSGIITELLRPIVIKEKGALWGTNDTTGKFLFEAQTRPDNSTFEVRVPYADIPILLRSHIGSVLEVKLKRKATPDEVSETYSQMLMGTQQ